MKTGAHAVFERDYLYVASDYYHDAEDFLQRYRLTVDHFYAIKSKRFKLFVDLRMAAECVLKSCIVYNTCKGIPRRDVVKKAEGYSHSIEKMRNDIEPFFDHFLFSSLNKYLIALNNLPVGLRYRLDGMDYREVNENFYYQTIGDDDWLDGLHQNLREISKDIGAKLSSHSRIVSISELKDEILQPSFNKYRDGISRTKKSRV